jgi:L-threonylcarbamoyladenylate synthase
LSGHAPPRTAQAVMADLAEKIDLILDAGPTPGGVESTVLDLSVDPPRILRRGARVDEIEEALVEETKRVLGHRNGQ